MERKTAAMDLLTAGLARLGEGRNRRRLDA